MELIRRTRKKLSKSGKTMQPLGLFFCPYCKKEVERYLSALKHKSCGCQHKKHLSDAKKTHGDSNTNLYSVWVTMRKRCYNKKSPLFINYGKKGITVCDEWKMDYVEFKKWAIENKYDPSLQIDRIDNNGNYCPENCRFVTPAENSRNRSSTVLNWDLVHKIRDYYKSGLRQTEISKILNINIGTVNNAALNITWKE